VGAADRGQLAGVFVLRTAAVTLARKGGRQREAVSPFSYSPQCMAEKKTKRTWDPEHEGPFVNKEEKVEKFRGLELYRKFYYTTLCTTGLSYYKFYKILMKLPIVLIF
jgi:hypothetical protein